MSTTLTAATPDQRRLPKTAALSDALVFFGATGDLAYKQIFPSLQQMIRHGNLDVPVIGVAKAGWSLDQLRERARQSLEKHGGVDTAAFSKLMELLNYIDGDYPIRPRSINLASCCARRSFRPIIWPFLPACFQQ